MRISGIPEIPSSRWLSHRLQRPSLLIVGFVPKKIFEMWLKVEFLPGMKGQGPPAVGLFLLPAVVP